jgi:hypothetical protein
MPPAAHPLLVGLVDPRTPSRPRHTEELKQALRNLTFVLLYEEVLDTEWFLLHSTRTLRHWGRLYLAGFLWGNRIDAPTIYLILQPLVKIGSQQDIKGVIDSLMSGVYDKTWYYFSTRHQIHLKFNDEVQEPLNDYTRCKIALYQYGRLLDICGCGGRPWHTAYSIQRDIQRGASRERQGGDREHAFII